MPSTWPIQCYQMVETDLSRIPPFPPVAAKLLHLLADADVDIESLAETLRADPALSGEILRRANSPLFCLASQVSTLQQALMVLGLQRARKMVVTIATGSYLGVTSRYEELRRCWRHTLATAFLAEELAWACSLHEDRAFTAGLLHDIGRLALFAAHPKPYADLLRVAADNAYDVLECEIEQFGMDHCEAGRQLAERWRLPLEIGVIAGRHHDRAPSDSLDLLTLVHLGCRLADSLGYEAVKAARPSTAQEILAALPGEARRRFCPDIGQLKAALDQELEAYEANEIPALAPAETLVPRQVIEPAPAAVHPPFDAGLLSVRPAVALAGARLQPAVAPPPASSSRISVGIAIISAVVTALLSLALLTR